MTHENRSEASPLSPFQALYLADTARLGELIAAVEGDWSRQTFHHAMWLVMAFGGNQTVFANEHGYQPTTVSRWVNGTKAPPRLRRGPIVRDAFAHLKKVMLASPPVVLRDFSEDDETPAPDRKVAGRPRMHLA
ncbi:hypothetical protein [Caulobacter segnis]|uniref:hypothetical protein n=1 Tax=Caulobacter segnis TaxID=88688 RepID=UPI001CC12BB1|nr:hypothetical protein [Caulobacter segnis]UAL10211.1 hypothetical protein K8940_20975 [Caulobacter segnis]